MTKQDKRETPEVPAEFGTLTVEDIPVPAVLAAMLDTFVAEYYQSTTPHNALREIADKAFRLGRAHPARGSAHLQQRERLLRQLNACETAHGPDGDGVGVYVSTALFEALRTALDVATAPDMYTAAFVEEAVQQAHATGFADGLKFASRGTGSPSLLKKALVYLNKWHLEDGASPWTEEHDEVKILVDMLRPSDVPAAKWTPVPEEGHSFSCMARSVPGGRCTCGVERCSPDDVVRVTAEAPAACTCGVAEGDGNAAPVLDVRCPKHGPRSASAPPCRHPFTCEDCFSASFVRTLKESHDAAIAELRRASASLTAAERRVVDASRTFRATPMLVHNSTAAWMGAERDWREAVDALPAFDVSPAPVSSNAPPQATVTEWDQVKNALGLDMMHSAEDVLAEIRERHEGQQALIDANGELARRVTGSDPHALALYIVDFLVHRNRAALRDAFAQEDKSLLADELVEILKAGGHPPHWAARRARKVQQPEAVVKSEAGNYNGAAERASSDRDRARKYFDGHDERPGESAEDELVRVLGDVRRETVEACAKVCEAYGVEGDSLSKEYACETAQELAARLRASLFTPSEPKEES